MNKDNDYGFALKNTHLVSVRMTRTGTRTIMTFMSRPSLIGSFYWKPELDLMLGTKYWLNAGGFSGRNENQFQFLCFVSVLPHYSLNSSGHNFLCDTCVLDSVKDALIPRQ